MFLFKLSFQIDFCQFLTVYKKEEEEKKGKMNIGAALVLKKKTKKIAIFSFS